MSILQTPRIYFRGNVTWDPFLTNNYPNLWDIETSKPVFDATNGTTVEAYRKTAADSVLKGNWNPDGSHRSTFYDTFVTGVDTGDGLTTDDAFVGVPVSLQAMLVDVNSYITNTSQLFFDGMSWGIDGGNRIAARSVKRMTGSHINFARNPTYQVIAGVASVFWQASFPWSNLQIDDRGSDAIRALLKHRDAPDVLGLTMRMNTYRTVYYGNFANEQPSQAQQEDLRNAILRGGFHPNPAQSVLVGTLGLWRRHEPSVVPGDRFLPPAPGACGVAAAYACVQGDSLCLDLSNSIPETGFDLTKRNFGSLAVTATRPDGIPVPLGTLAYEDYAKAAYERTSGLVVLALDTEAKRQAAASGTLSIDSETTGHLFLERRFHAVPEEPSLYLDQGQAKPIEVRVLDRGAPPDQPVKLTAAVLGDGANADVVTTDDQGRVTISLRGGPPGESPVYLGAWQGDEAPAVPSSANALNSDTDAYVSLRVMPLDEKVAAMEPTWANVHEQVLRDWEALAPCMDNWLRLGDEAQCAAFAPMILKLTGVENFEAYRYMPVTRGMTSGQRALLHAWCRSVIDRDAPAPVPEAPVQAPPKQAARELLVGGLDQTTSPGRKDFPRGTDDA